MRFIAIAAIGAALGACSKQPANNSANASAPANAAVAANASAPAAPAAMSYGQAAAPADSYARYFNQRWGTAGAPVTPAEVEQMLRGQTPQQVVNALYGTGENSRWDTVASGIARGDPAWLALAVRLSQGTDAGTSDDFAIASGDALTTNPTGALRMLSQIEMRTGACTENGFEVPAEQARAFFQTARASVERVTEPDLQALKTACLNELRQGEAGYPGLGGAVAKQ